MNKEVKKSKILRRRAFILGVKIFNNRYSNKVNYITYKFYKNQNTVNYLNLIKLKLKFYIQKEELF